MSDCNYETIPVQVKAQKNIVPGLTVEINRQQVAVPVNYWIVLTPTGSGVEILSDAEFTKKYRKIPATMFREAFPEDLWKKLQKPIPWDDNLPHITFNVPGDSGKLPPGTPVCRSADEQFHGAD